MRQNLLSVFLEIGSSTEQFDTSSEKQNGGCSGQQILIFNSRFTFFDFSLFFAFWTKAILTSMNLRLVFQIFQPKFSIGPNGVGKENLTRTSGAKTQFLLLLLISSSCGGDLLTDFIIFFQFLQQLVLQVLRFIQKVKLPTLKLIAGNFCSKILKFHYKNIILWF